MFGCKFKISPTCRRFGRLPVLFVGLNVMGISMVLFGLMEENLALLFIMRACQGIGGALAGMESLPGGFLLVESIISRFCPSRSQMAISVAITLTSSNFSPLLCGEP